MDESDSFACSHSDWHSELDAGNTYFMSERPKLYYFHSIVSRSSIYFIKSRSFQSNLCSGAFGVCSCRLFLDMVGIRKSFLHPKVWLHTLAFVGSVGKSHPSPLPSVKTPRCLHSQKRKPACRLPEVFGVSARSTKGMKTKRFLHSMYWPRSWGWREV